MEAGTPEEQAAGQHAEAEQAREDNLFVGVEDAMGGEEDEWGEGLQGGAGPVLPLPMEDRWRTQRVKKTARRRRLLSTSAAELAEELAEERRQGLRSAKKARRGDKDGGSGQGGRGYGSPGCHCHGILNYPAGWEDVIFPLPSLPGEELFPVFALPKINVIQYLLVFLWGGGIVLEVSTGVNHISRRRIFFLVSHLVTSKE